MSWTRKVIVLLAVAAVAYAVWAYVSSGPRNGTATGSEPVP